MKKNTEQSGGNENNVHGIQKISLELDKLKGQIADIENAFFNLSSSTHQSVTSNSGLDVKEITNGVVSWLRSESVV